MAAPVLTMENITWTMLVLTRTNYTAFALPPSYTKQKVSIPTNPAVEIVIQPKKKWQIFHLKGYGRNMRGNKIFKAAHNNIAKSGDTNQR